MSIKNIIHNRFILNIDLEHAHRFNMPFGPIHEIRIMIAHQNTPANTLPECDMHKFT